MEQEEEEKEGAVEFEFAATGAEVVGAENTELTAELEGCEEVVSSSARVLAVSSRSLARSSLLFIDLVSCPSLISLSLSIAVSFSFSFSLLSFSLSLLSFFFICLLASASCLDLYRRVLVWRGRLSRLSRAIAVHTGHAAHALTDEFKHDTQIR